jgi:hypothetical protein
VVFYIWALRQRDLFCLTVFAAMSCNVPMGVTDENRAPHLVHLLGGRLVGVGIAPTLSCALALLT